MFIVVQEVIAVSRVGHFNFRHERISATNVTIYLHGVVDEVGSLKMHVITDREFIVIPLKGVGSVDRSKQNFSYPIQTFKDCVASTHEVACGYTSFKVALRKFSRSSWMRISKCI